MRTRKGNKTALALAAAGILVLGATAARAADITVGSTTVSPSSEGSITVSLTVGETETAVGTENDIGFETGAAIPARMGAAALLSEAITADDAAIPVTDASGLQAFGTVAIEDEMVAYGRIDGNTLVAGGCTGGDAGNTPCLVDEDCSGGATCEPVGRGQGVDPATCPGAAGCPAAHAQGVEVATGLIPDCEASSDLGPIMKDAVFSYLPEGCVPGTDCDTVRGIVIALDNLGTFPTGTTDLYQCKIAAGETEDTFPLTCENGQVSDEPDGGLLPDVGCNPGEVIVSEVSGCVGDCNSSNSVTIGEVQRCVNILLETAELSVCEACDRNGNGSVTIGEVQESVNNLLTECPQ